MGTNLVRKRSLIPRPQETRPARLCALRRKPFGFKYSRSARHRWRLPFGDPAATCRRSKGRQRPRESTSVSLSHPLNLHAIGTKVSIVGSENPENHRQYGPNFWTPGGPLGVDSRSRGPGQVPGAQRRGRSTCVPPLVVLFNDDPATIKIHGLQQIANLVYHFLQSAHVDIHVRASSQ